MNYGYTIANANLPHVTTVDLYWASGPSASDEIGEPIVSKPTVTAQGPHTLQSSQAALGDAPQGATYLLTVADPGNTIAAGDSADVEAAELPDLSISDLTTDAEGDVSFDAEDQDAEPPTNPVVDLFWATGPSLSDVIGSPVYTAAIAGLGVEDPYKVLAPQLTNAPAGAQYLVAAADPKNQVEKVDDPAEVAGVPIPPAAVSVSTTDSIDTDTELGPNQPRIPFQPDFNVTVDSDPYGRVTQVVYSVDGGEPAQADKGDTAGQWTIPLDVGGLSAGTHTLTVTPEDSAGNSVGPPTPYTLDMQPGLDIDTLLATYPGGSTPIDATTLRFIQGIPLTVNFTGTSTDLPSYYVADGDITGVTVGGIQSTAPDFTIVSQGPETASFSFSTDVSKLNPTSTDVSTSNPTNANDVELLVPTQSGGTGVLPTSDSPALDVIAPPHWLTLGTSTFDPSTGQYTFDLSYPPEFQPAVPTLPETEGVAGYLHQPRQLVP